MTALNHVTLSTGDIRSSPRTEVGNDIVAALLPSVRAAMAGPQARAWLPGPDGYTLSISADGRDAMVATIWVTIAGREAPVVTFGVAREAHGSLWRGLAIGNDQPEPEAPWLAVRLEVGAQHIPSEHLRMMGDIERCVAWTWLEMLR